MLVIDLPRQEGSRRSERVAIIGSCRVKIPGATLINKGDAALVWNMPFHTHTATEALQNINFINRTIKISEFYVPLVFYEKDAADLAYCPADLWESIDTFLVEVCDLRHIRVGDIFLQQNYFKLNFLNPNSAAVLRWFREFSRGRDVSDATIDETMTNLRRGGLEIGKDVEELLRNGRMEKLDAQGLLAVMRQLVFDRSKKWIFTSHFTIPTESGALMEDRRQLSRALGDAAHELGAKLFDPTVFFEEYDRREILGGDGANPYEYASSFVDTVATRLLSEITAESVDSTELGAAPKKFQTRRPVKEIASRVDEIMLACHAERYSRLGLEESGLYQHYKILLDGGSLILESVREVANLLSNFMPKYDHYVVTNVGLGELAFLLAACGLSVTALEQYAMRCRGVEAGLARLRESDPAAADRCLVMQGYLPDSLTPTPNTLAVAIDALVPHERADEATLLRKFAAFDALLVNPRLFLRLRETKEEQDEVIELLHHVGFTKKVRHVNSWLLYFEREKNQSPT
jgi:hypothetical protein